MSTLFSIVVWAGFQAFQTFQSFKKKSIKKTREY